MSGDSGSQNVSLAVSPMQGGSDTLSWHSSSSTGQSSQLDETMSWAGTAVFITHVVLQAGAMSYTCALSPAVEVAPSPLAVGESWSSDSSCSTSGGTVHWTEQDRVTGTDTVQVGGVSVLTDVIAASRTLTFTTATSTFTSRTTTTDWLAPSLGLEVRDQSTTTTSSGGTSKSGTATLQLESTQAQ